MTGRSTPKLSLHDGMKLAEMTSDRLWLDYLSLGGNAGELEVEAYTLGLLVPDALQHNLIAQAINETFIDNGLDHPVGYRDPEE